MWLIKTISGGIIKNLIPDVTGYAHLGDQSNFGVRIGEHTINTLKISSEFLLSAIAPSLRTRLTRILSRVFASLLFLCSSSGCHSVPIWTKVLLQESPYYHQGTGLKLATAEQAKRYALLDLVANANGIEVEQELRYLQTDNSSVINGRVETLQKSEWESYVTTRLRGKVDAGAQVVENFERDGLYSAYAIAPKAGLDRQLDAEYKRRINNLKVKSLVPGWSQLQKNENTKAIRIISVAALSGVTGLISTLLQSEFEARRRHSTTAIDYDYYDMLAQRSYWIRVGAAIVFGGNYLVSTLDGLFTPPARYRVILGFGGIDEEISNPQPNIAVQYASY